MSTESAAPAPAPQPEKKGGGVAKKIVTYVVGLIVLGAAVYGFNYFTSDAAQSKAGDCASVTGTASNPEFKVVDCSSAEAGYTIGKVAGSTTESCGADYSEYTETQRRGPKTKLCLAPIWAEGKCYNPDGPDMAVKAVECGAGATVKVTKVVKDAAAAACAEGERALSFPEAKLNYCFGSPA